MFRSIVRKILSLPAEILNRVLFRIHNVSIGSRSRIAGNVKVINRGNILIGDNCTFSGGKSAIGFSDRCCLVTESGGKIEIGDYFAMSNSTIYSRTSVKIGNHVMIGGGCKIYDTDFHSVDAQWRGTGQDKQHAVNKPVVIDDYVFIGAGSFILKGVHIGEGAVIGAGAVVTKDIPANEIWAGNPAKKIKD